MNQGYAYREVVAPASAGRTLLAHLLQRWRHGGEPEWTARLARGEVSLAGAPASGGETLAAGQELVWRRPPWEEPPAPLSFALLHADAHLLAVAKPAGLPTLPSGGRYLEHSLLHVVRARWPEATPLHRLDRGTSGIVVFARTPLARREVGRAWQRGEVKRVYRGLLEGTPGDPGSKDESGDGFVIDAPIGELPHPAIGRVFGVVDGGRPARTRVRVLARRATTTLVEITLESGRPHQIRIHLAHVGLPLVGEPFFGIGGRPAAGGDARPGDIGYLLHAERLALRDPADGKPLEFWCSAPPRLRLHGEPPPEETA